MKRKFLSTLLMGALFVASMSVLTSCKDYDDDIKAVNEDVATLRSDLQKQIDAIVLAQQNCAKDRESIWARLTTAEGNINNLPDADAVKKAIQAAIDGTFADVDQDVWAKVRDYVQAQAELAANDAKTAALSDAEKKAKDLIAELEGKYDLAKLAQDFASLSGYIGGIQESLNLLTEGNVLSRLQALEGTIENLDIEKAALAAFEKALKEKFGDVDLTKIDGRLSEVEDKLNTHLANYEAAMKAEVDKLRQELKDADNVPALISRLQAAENVLFDGENVNVITLSDLKDEQSALNLFLTQNISSAIAPLNMIQFMIAKQLTSIVLKPSFYYSGIEAIELPALYQNSWKVANALTLQETWSENANAMIDVCEGGIAWYHMNPYSADLEGSKISFITNLAETRAGVDDADITLITPTAQLTNESRSKVYPGLVPVEFKGSFDRVNSLLRAGKLPMVALKYEQTVTEGEGEDAKVSEINLNSDWGLLAPTQYKDLLVADVLFEQKHNDDIMVPDNGHLTRDLVALADEDVPATHGVKYDKTFNLTKAVATHYSYVWRDAAGVEQGENDKVMTEELFNQFGLSYKFDLVNYKRGENDTDQSVHMVIEENEDGDMVARPVQVNREGTAAELDEDGRAKDADLSAVGRMPIVRVLIMKGDLVAAYAYMKLEITEYEPVDEPDESVTETFSEPFYVDCDQEDYEGQLKWIDVEYDILHVALNGKYSKSTFENNWTLVGYTPVVGDVPDGSAEDADQYTDAKDAAKLDPADEVGQVKLVWDGDHYSQRTQVLRWTFTKDWILNHFVDADGNLKEDLVDANGYSTEDFTIYVKFEGPKNVWVKLYVPKGTFRFAVGTVDDNKLAYNWYALNKNTEGKKETHANVVVPNTRDDDCIFEWDLLSAFDEAKITASPEKIDGAQKFPSFAANAKLTLAFTTPSKSTKDNAAFEASKIGNFEDAWIVKGMSGTQYVLQVNAAKDQVLAVGEMDGSNVVAYATPIWIVKIEQGAGPAGLKSKMTYNQANVPLDILNYKGHLQLGDRESFTAYLKIALKDCYYMIMKNKSEYFNVRFLRPVDMDPTTDKTIQDAKDGGEIINVMDLVSLSDWRGLLFKDNIKDPNGSQAGVNYKNYNKAQWVNDPWNDWTTKGQFNFTATENQNANPHYIRYYNVVEIAADVNETRYDGHLSEAERVLLDPKTEVAKIEALKKMKVSAPLLTFDYTAPVAGITWNGSKFVGGEIFYANNTGTAQNFHIYVPLTITYKWGPKTESMKQKCWGVINVKKTLGNAKEF